MPRKVCPVCKRLLLVEPSGPPSSKILIVGEYPGFEEIKQGVPWVGQAGKVLDQELERAGLPRDGCRVTNLWLHVPPPKPKFAEPKTMAAKERRLALVRAYEPEFRFHLSQVHKEMRGKRAVLLMGSDVTEALLGVSVNSVASCFVNLGGVEVAVAMMNPAIVFRPGPEGKLGETRLAIRRFVGAVNG